MEPISGKYLGHSIWSKSIYTTSPRPVLPPLPFSHHLLGLLPNCMLRYPFPLSVKFTSTLPQANQHLVAEVQSPLQPRTDKTYKVKTWASLFFPTSQVSLVFSFASHSLATSWLACSTTLNPILVFAKAFITVLWWGHMLWHMPQLT